MRIQHWWKTKQFYGRTTTLILRTLCVMLAMVTFVFSTANAVEPVYFEPVTAPEPLETAVIKSVVENEPVAVYAMPTTDSVLLGQYYDGVTVNILAYEDDAWILADIFTYGTGGYCYIKTENLVFGDAANDVENGTHLFKLNQEVTLSTHAMGQSGELGHYEAQTVFELLGFRTNEQSGTQLPLSADTATWHIRIGDETGYAVYVDADAIQDLKP